MQDKENKDTSDNHFLWPSTSVRPESLLVATDSEDSSVYLEKKGTSGTTSGTPSARRSATLWDLEMKALQLLSMVDAPEEEGISSEELVDACRSALTMRQEKRQAFAEFLLQLENQISFLEQEEDRIKQRRQRLEKRQQELEAMILSVIDVVAKEKRALEAGAYTIKARNCPPSLDVVNADQVPPKYKVVKTETVIDKQAAARDLKQGLDVPGCELKQKQKVVIK